MKKVFFIISGIAVLACYSCTSDLVLDPSTPVVDFASPQRLAKDSKVLSLDDAVLLTDLYGVDTKSSKTVTDVIPIKDSDGDVVIYAVNYNDGYLLVSAYKTMPPILAEIQHGSFSEDTENIMIETLRDQASIHKFDEMSVELTMAWSMYEDTVLPEIADTKAYGDVYGAIAAKMQEWRNEGYNVYRLDQCPPGLLQWEYQMMIDEAACYERDGYDYMTYSYITERVECQQWQGGPHMNTTWGGQYPYYPTSGQAYRSAAVSVGQM